MLISAILESVISSIFEIIRNKVKKSPQYAYFTIIQVVMLLPITLMASLILSLVEQFPTIYGIQTEGLFTFLIAIILLFSIGIIFGHLLSFNTKYRNIVKLFGVPIVEDGELSIEQSAYQHALINTAHGFLIIFTIIGGVLWYVIPSKERLEPLTVILATFTVFIGYLRNRYDVPNPLDKILIDDMLIEQSGNAPSTLLDADILSNGTSNFVSAKDDE